MHKIGGDYYPICLDLKFSRIYMIWIGDEIDTVLLNDTGKIVAYRSIDALKAFALSASIDFKGDVVVYDTHIIQQWLTSPEPRIDSELFLNHWNLFTDVGESLNIPFIGDVKNDIRNTVYDKLFNGSGIFTSEDPNPEFDDVDVADLEEIMRSGIELLLSNLYIR